MQLNIIIQALRERCPTFSQRVAGAAQFKALPEATAMNVPAAFVIPLDDTPGDSVASNATRQPLTEGFAVVVAVANTVDERGQASANSMDAVRAELWSALLGWRVSDEHEGCVYEGGFLLALDRARLWYQFEFSAETEIGPEDGWADTALAGLPHFDGVNFNADYLDPADPNRVTELAPDGRIEVAFSSPQDPDDDLPT